MEEEPILVHQLMKLVATRVREGMGARVLSYVEDFMLAPNQRRTNTVEDCEQVSAEIEKNTRTFGFREATWERCAG